MDDVTLARAIHVLAVVLWIGGVALVTTVLLPAARRLKSPEQRITFFESVEQRFASQSRVTTVLAGLSGLYMIYRLDLWGRFASAEYWWMHAMVGVWLLFSLLLFIAEPLFLHRWVLARAETAPDSTFRLVQWLHWVLLSLSILTILGAVAGSHGSLLFSWAGWSSPERHSRMQVKPNGAMDYGRTASSGGPGQRAAGNIAGLRGSTLIGIKVPAL